MKFICVVLLIIGGITDSDEYEVIGPSAPVMTVSGEDVILPCSIKPNISAVNMRVQWFRLDLKGSIVHLYEDHKDINTDQLQSYRGRTQVFKEELEKGNTSLKLSRVQISDEGLYKCFIQSESWYDDVTVDLKVEGGHNNIDGGEMFHSWKSSVISFAVVLSLIAVMLIVVVVYKQRGLQTEPQRINEERDTLLLREERTESVTSLLRKHAVNVTLDTDSAHPRLIVSHEGKQVRYENKDQTEENQDEEPNNTFDNYLGVVGNEGFSSGCFYYEVQVEGMVEWYVGVARESVSRKGPVSLTPQNGYWSVAKGTFSLWACEDSYVLLSLSVKPERIGVFVDYEKSRVSFYDVESMCHIYSFTDQSFNEKIYPFVSLGYKWSKNSSPLIFCSDRSPVGDSYKNT